jgi:hypothetical protein
LFLSKLVSDDLKEKVVFAFVEEIQSVEETVKNLMTTYPKYVFEPRYGVIPSRIFIRQCYVDLYNMSADNMVADVENLPVTLFTGVPGIGKSLFIFYFIHRFLNDDRFKDKTFAVELNQSEYFCFSPTGVKGEFFVKKSNDVRFVSTCLVLSDIKDVKEPAGRTKWLFIFSSPNPLRYKETMKNGPQFTYTMPTWSEQELICLNSNVHGWYANFVLFGGVPRYVFWNGKCDDPKSTLNKVITSKGLIVAENFFTSGYGSIDTEASYIQHINPPWDDSSNTWLYSDVSDHSFASDEIFVLLRKKYERSLLATATSIFNSGDASATYGNVSAGNFFEKICLWLVPLSNNRIKIENLLTKAERTVTLPDMAFLPRDWKNPASEGNKLTTNVLYQPRISNLESGDAFCVIFDDDNSSKLTLIVLQITVGASHPVKVNEISKIFGSFRQAIQEKIQTKLLVFVTPFHGTLNVVQPWHTVDNKVCMLIPVVVQDFCQCVFGYKIPNLQPQSQVPASSEQTFQATSTTSNVDPTEFMSD